MYTALVACLVYYRVAITVDQYLEPRIYQQDNFISSLSDLSVYYLSCTVSFIQLQVVLLVADEKH